MCIYHETAGLFTIHEAFGNSTRSQNLISVTRDHQSVRFSVKNTLKKLAGSDSSRTAGGTPGRQFCWGNLVGRFGYPPTHHYTSAAPRPSERPAFQPGKKILLILFHLLFIAGYCVMDHCNDEFHYNFLELFLNKSGIRVTAFAFKSLMFSAKLRNNAHLPFSRGWG